MSKLNDEIIENWSGIFKHSNLNSVGEIYKSFMISLLENQRIHNKHNDNLEAKFKRISIPLCLRVMQGLREKKFKVKSDIRYSAKAWRTGIKPWTVEDRFKPHHDLNKESEQTAELTKSIINEIVKKLKPDFYLLGFTLDDGELIVYYDNK